MSGGLSICAIAVRMKSRVAMSAAKRMIGISDEIFACSETQENEGDHCCDELQPDRI